MRIYVTNRLPEPTSVHWHGMLLPNGMDGVAGLTQKPIEPGETFKYEFTLRQHGTHMYHPHFDEMTQMGLGMMGCSSSTRATPKAAPDRDFAIMLSEWRIDPGTSRPNPDGNDRVQRPDHELQGISRHRPAGRASRATGCASGSEPGGDGSSPDPPSRHDFKITETDGGQSPSRHSAPTNTVLVPWARRGRSSSSPTSRATGRFTVT